MTLRFLFLSLLSIVSLSPLRAESPPVLEEKPLPEIRASIALPKDWFVHQEKDEDVVIYQFSRENPGEGVLTAGLILTVTPKVLERTAMKPSQYGIEMLSAMGDEDAPKIQPVTEGPIETSRVVHLSKDESGAIQTVNIAKANDTSGTLYFLTWQAPAAEEESLKDLREKILSSLKIDPTF